MTLQRILGAAALTLVITAASAAAMSDQETAPASPPSAAMAPEPAQTSAALDPDVDPGG